MIIALAFILYLLVGCVVTVIIWLLLSVVVLLVETLIKIGKPR